MEQGHILTLIGEGVNEAPEVALDWPVRRSLGGKAVWPSGERIGGYRRRRTAQPEAALRQIHRISSPDFKARGLPLRFREPLGWTASAAIGFMATVGAAFLFAVVGWLSS